MSQTTPPTVDALPTAPNTSVPTGFSATMDAFLAALIVFRTQVVALGANMYANCLDAFNSAVAAAASAVTALGYSNNAAASAAAAIVTANATLWVSGTTYAQYANVISPANARTYRRKTASGSGATDPSADATNYEPISVVPYALTLLATLTPTAAANVDFLTTFSSSYDNYRIMVEGVVPSSADTLSFRFANAGVVDTTSVYSGASSGQVSGSTVTATGHSCAAVITNVNDAVNAKLLASQYGNGIGAGILQTYYTKTATVSGIRFYWTSGSNFTATGKIRIYGYANT